jgi:hypothetical protein
MSEVRNVERQNVEVQNVEVRNVERQIRQIGFRRCRVAPNLHPGPQTIPRSSLLIAALPKLSCKRRDYLFDSKAYAHPQLFFVDSKKFQRQFFNCRAISHCGGGVRAI